jgi:hypothetical protein
MFELGDWILRLRMQMMQPDNFGRFGRQFNLSAGVRFRKLTELVIQQRAKGVKRFLQAYYCNKASIENS